MLAPSKPKLSFELKREQMCPGAGNTIRFSRSGELMITSDGKYGSARIWELTPRHDPAKWTSYSLKGHTAGVAGVAISPCGCFAASASLDTTVKLWNTWSGDASSVSSPSALSSSMLSKTISNSPSLGSCLHTFSHHSKSVYAVEFSGDAAANGSGFSSFSSPSAPLLLASASDDGTIRLYDVAQRVLIRTMSGHLDGVASIAFSHCGTRLVSGGFDSLVGIWSVATGACMRVLKACEDSVLAVKFDASGELVIAGSDTACRVFDVTSGTLVRIIGASEENAKVHNVVFANLVGDRSISDNGNSHGQIFALCAGEGVDVWTMDA